MHTWLARLLSAAALLLLASTAGASTRASGTFTAERACEAYKSFRNKTNPGAVALKPGASYQVVEINSREWSWIRIDMPGVQDSPRWVASDCGKADIGDAVPSASASARQSGQCTVRNQHDSHLLAMSWQPGFCEHFPYEGRKPECDALASRKLNIDHLTLHGLWPNKQSCGTRYGNCEGPPLQLEKSTIAQIAPWMPNFRYESKFGEYEWKKHGTCQQLPDDEYFLSAVSAVKLVNDSAIGTYIRDNLGKTISIKRFLAHVKQAHGEQVASRVSLICSRGRYLQEIRLALPVNFRTTGSIEQMVQGEAPGAKAMNRCGSDEIYIERSGPN